MRQIACPNCQTLVIYDQSNPYRPFCSERCKMLDFGAWATEEYAIIGSNLAATEELE